MVKNNPIAYTNARLLDAASGRDEIGDLLIKDGKIAAVGSAAQAEIQVMRKGDKSKIYDCRGLCLSPGFLDMRVLLSGSHFSNRDGGTWRAAAAGGVTSLVCLPDGEPLLDNKAMIDLMARLNRPDAVKLYCYGTMTQAAAGENLSEIGLMQEAGAVAFTDGRKAVMRSDVMLRLMLYAKNFDALLIQHAEDADLVGDGVMNMGEIATRLGLPSIPVQAESALLARDLELLRLTGGRYHVAHVSSYAALRLIRQAKREGLDITCDTAPHYFTLNEAAVENYRTFAKVSPPLRSESDRQAVCEALADGTIDIIASDHIPQNEDLKRLPFASAAFGVIGLETLLPVSLGLVHNGTMDLLHLIKLLTVAPAHRLGLPCGRLQAGAAADIVLFDPDHAWRLALEDLQDSYKNTAFEGHLLHGKVVRTLCGGTVVYDDAKLSAFKD